MGISTAVAILGGSLIAGASARQAGKAIARGEKKAIAESKRQFDLQRGDQLPAIETGQSALARLRATLGLTRGDDPGGPGDLSFFEESPGFQFRQEQGQAAIDRSLVARGKSLSGQGVIEGVEFASGLASQEFGNFFDRLMRLAGVGSSAGAVSAAAGSASAGQIGSAAIAAGGARASAFGGLNRGIQGGISNFLLLDFLKDQKPPSPATLGAGGPVT